MYFRVSLHKHAVGEIVHPGNFAEAYRIYRPGGPYPHEPNFTNLLIEIALESGRKAVKPNAPSRMESIFCCETIDHAKAFQERYRGGEGVIHGVEAVFADTPTFRGSFSAISTLIGTTPYIDYLSDWARDYWTTPPSGIIEVLVGGPVRVLTHFDS